MNRSQWKFDYTASKLLEAAKKKKEHHEARYEFWLSKKKEVMEKVKDGGINVVESLGGYQGGKSGYMDPEIEIDAALRKGLEECHTKLKEHERKIRDYEGWIQLFLAQPEARMPLDQDDFLYFFGE